MTLKPTHTFTITADGYIINVKDRIGISQNFDVTAADLAANPALAAVGVGGNINYFANGFSTSTKGIDVVGTWRTRLLDGNLTWTLAYNYNKSKVTSIRTFNGRPTTCRWSCRACTTPGTGTRSRNGG